MLLYRDTTWCSKTGDLHCFLVDHTENVSFLSTDLVITVNFLMSVKTRLILKCYFFFFFSHCIQSLDALAKEAVDF